MTHHTYFLVVGYDDIILRRTSSYPGVRKYLSNGRNRASALSDWLNLILSIHSNGRK